MAAPSQSLSQVANQRVNQILAPQLAQQTSYGAHQNAVIRAFANSLLGRLQPIAGQVGGDYDAAIKQIGGLSANAASYLSGQNPAASQQALLQSVGAPAEQQAQSQQQLGNTFNGGAGVLSFTQGVVPGSELAGNKAAAMAQARTLPAIGALAGQQSLASALYQQGQNRQTLEAQRPGLVQGEEAAIQKTNLANAAIRQRAQAATATAHYREAQLKLGYAKVNQTAADKAAERAATKTYHDAYLHYLGQGLSEHVAHDKASEDAATTRNAIAQQNANTATYKAHHPAASANTQIITVGKRQWLVNKATGVRIRDIGPAPAPTAAAKAGSNAQFTTAVKIGAKYLGSLGTTSIQTPGGTVTTQKRKNIVHYPTALSAMENYWRDTNPGWTPKQVTAEAKRTLGTIPGYFTVLRQNGLYAPPA